MNDTGSSSNFKIVVLVLSLKKQPPEVFYQKAALKSLAIFLCWSFFLVKLFTCEYCKILKSTYFDEHLRTAVSLISTLSTSFKSG